MKSGNVIIIEDGDVILELLGNKNNPQRFDIFKLGYEAAETGAPVDNFAPDIVVIYLDKKKLEAGIKIIEYCSVKINLPVIAVADSEDETIIEKAALFGPAFLFIMPVRPVELYSMVKNLIKLNEKKPVLPEVERDMTGNGNSVAPKTEEEQNKIAGLFEDSPIPICEEDFSQMKKYFNILKNSGITNFREYFEQNSEEIKKCSGFVQINRMNKEARKLIFGTSRRDISYDPPSLLLSDSSPVFKEEVIAFAEGKNSYESELSISDKNGEKKAVIIKIKTTPGNEETLKQVLVSFFDISERKSAEEKVMASLKEKEILLKEIHHRVKNNLQIISSLLNLQSEYITDKASKELFYDSLNRIRSMALIHERLYQSKNFSKINVLDYIKDVTNYLLRTYKNNQREIKVELGVENLSISIEYAIPLGLLINEVVSNSLKYAFNGLQSGLITISMRNGGGGNYELLLKDNGTGIPEQIDFRNTKSLGLQLVNNLVEQLDGNIELERKSGTQFIIKFDLNEQ
jgi:two-component sensor histidine kinase